MMITGKSKEVNNITDIIKKSFKISRWGHNDFILGINGSARNRLLIRNTQTN